MKILPFHSSSALSIGAELEFQMIDPSHFDLAGKAKELIRIITESNYQAHIKPEMTQSMIEVNSSIHTSPRKMLKELISICWFLNEEARKLRIHFCGGGTHPFQSWSARKIFPTFRFKRLSRQYGYLAKRFTVFALHIHIGCTNGEEAIYLMHRLSRYVPQLIALSASSPFYQGVDTHYHSARLNVANAFPLSGVAPEVVSWRAFSAYYHKMCDLKIIESIKDFYWDIRPKPEFGTVEVRVCDIPLTLEKTVMIVAYLQALARAILKSPHSIATKDLYLVYNYNRFQACRHGYDGDFIHPDTKRHSTIYEDILETFDLIKPHAKALGTSYFIRELQKTVYAKENDATLLREIYHKTGSLKKVVKQMCRQWRQNL